jgi:hypothetical protein
MLIDINPLAPVGVHSRVNPVLQFDRLNLADQGLLIRVQILQRFHRLVGKPGQTIDVALRKLKGSISLQIERKDPRIRLIFLLVSLEGFHRRIVTDSTLHIRQVYDAVVRAIGGQKYTMKVSSRKLCIAC